MRATAMSAIPIGQAWRWLGRAGSLAILLMAAPWWAPVALAQPAPFSQWSPSGSITTSTPNFSWQQSGGATQYWFEIDTSAGKRVFSSYYQDACYCAGGACSVTPAITLTAGSYQL